MSVSALAEAVATESNALITRDPRGRRGCCESKIWHATSRRDAVWVRLPAAQFCRWIDEAVPGRVCVSLLI
jgi:hypothetical protein